MRRKPTILITRPLQDALALSNLLEQHGFATIICPTLEIQPTVDLSQLTTMFEKLFKYQSIIFNSANAVRCAGPCLYQAYLHLSQPPQIYAIGKATAQALSHLGFKSVIYPTNEFSSEGLIHLLNTTTSNPKQGKPTRSLLITGEGGRSNYLVKKLSPLGIAVTVLPCYKRTCPTALHPEIWQEWGREGVTHIVATSQDALHNLWLMQRSIESLNFIRQCHIVTLSLRIAQYAETLQLQKISITNEASNEGILDFFKNLDFQLETD